jgi:hypothetical protein
VESLPHYWAEKGDFASQGVICADHFLSIIFQPYRTVFEFGNFPVGA